MIHKTISSFIGSQIRIFFNYISHGLLSKNAKFKNKHKGEECYIFGNGNSIKYFDLSQFSDKISFGCNLLHVHKNLSDLDMRYYVIMHPLSFCKYWRGVKSGLYVEKNPFFYNFHDFAKIRECTFFTHVTNYPFTKKYNKFNYLHNFKKHNLSINKLDYTLSSSFSKGALVTMIGLAIFMGFKKIYLVGCDYWFDPISIGHFYSDKKNRIDESSGFLFKNLMKSISDKVKLIVVTRNGTKSPVDFIEYTDLTGASEINQLASNIVSTEDLAMLEKTLYLRK